jgi:hypothetical protein
MVDGLIEILFSETRRRVMTSPRDSASKILIDCIQEEGVQDEFILDDGLVFKKLSNKPLGCLQMNGYEMKIIALTYDVSKYS